MTAQVAIALPEPALPEMELAVQVFRSAARTVITHGDDGALEVDILIPQAWRLTKAEALESIAALRVLLAAAEGALRANDAPESEEQQ